MKKIFEIPEMEVVRFVEADIVVCSGCCAADGSCTAYTCTAYTCTDDTCTAYTCTDDTCTAYSSSYSSENDTTRLLADAYSTY